MHSWMVGVEEGGWEVGSSGKKWHWSRKWQEGAVLTFPFPCIYHRFRSHLSTCSPSTFRGRQKKLHPKPPPPQQVVVILLYICFIMVWSCVIALGLTKTTVALFSSDLFMKSKDGLKMHEGVFPSSVFFFCLNTLTCLHPFQNCFCYYWSLLYSTLLCFQADSPLFMFFSAC